MKKVGYKIVGIIVFGTVLITGLSAAVMYLWNYALAPSIGINPLSYWQAMAILVLSKILLTGFRPRKHGGHWKHKWRSKMHNMSDEEREQFREKWAQRCGPRKN